MHQSSVVSHRSSDIVRVVAAAVLAVFIVVGSLFLWIGIPLAGMWLAGQLTNGGNGFLFAVLGGIPLAMVGFGWLLYRVSSVYEGLRVGEREALGRRSAWLVSATDERGRARRARAPRLLIDSAMAFSAVAALVLLAVWFFLFAHQNLVTPL
jgi:hypothetical protein